MAEYSFTSIRVFRGRDGLRLDRDYRDVITERAREGWEFVQAISFETHVNARLDLVFTREGDSS